MITTYVKDIVAEPFGPIKAEANLMSLFLTFLRILQSLQTLEQFSPTRIGLLCSLITFPCNLSYFPIGPLAGQGQ